MGLLAWLKGRVRFFVFFGAPVLARRALSSSPLLSLTRTLPPQTVDPLLDYARAGTSPRILARSLALGFALGLCPIVGVPLPLCGLAVGVSRLMASRRASSTAAMPPPPPPIHGPALFIGNFASAPAEVLLAIPFIRLGEALTGAPPFPLDPAHLSIRTAGVALARGLLAWALAVPFVAAGGAAALEPLVAGLVGVEAGGQPGLSPPPTPGEVGGEGALRPGEGDPERGAARPVSDRAPLLPPVLAGTASGRVRRASPPGSPKGD